MDDREIANGNWIISFKVTPRFIESSGAEGERKEGWTYGWVSRTKWRDFCVISLLNFYFPATSPRSLRSLLSTMNDLFFHPFSPCLSGTSLPYFQRSPVGRVYLKRIFNRILISLLFLTHGYGYRWLRSRIYSALIKHLRIIRLRLDANFSVLRYRFRGDIHCLSPNPQLPVCVGQIILSR